ncbi:hypothetical protein ONE63_000028 [Megalurothrips usitatus]|uniref:BEN domain-containing protein n=1 Tax=Megalurothrips usitatus TaxID=439358 RepID=A0AAV7XX70_9NEOP|nr:hypothetical protein ONE63_000028 [Megalurothrips usitatus]
MGLIKYTDGMSYMGKIIKVKGNTMELDEVESELYDQIKKNTEEVATKRKSVKLVRSGPMAKGVSAASTSNGASHDAQSDDDVVDNGSEAEDDVLEEDIQGRGCDKDDIEGGSNSHLEIYDMSRSDEEGDKELKEFRNPNTEWFLMYLLQCVGSKGITSRSTKSTSDKVRLVKGHSLRICKAGRNMLIVDKKSQKSPSNFVRKILVHLYGVEQLKQMTAMGRRKNSLSISKDDLSAIFDFISEHTASIPWDEFAKSGSKKSSPTKSDKVTEIADSDRNEAATENNVLSVVASPLKFRDKVEVTTRLAEDRNKNQVSFPGMGGKFNSSRMSPSTDSSRMSPSTDSSRTPPSTDSSSMSPNMAKSSSSSNTMASTDINSSMSGTMVLTTTRNNKCNSKCLSQCTSQCLTKK